MSDSWDACRPARSSSVYVKDDDGSMTMSMGRVSMGWVNIGGHSAVECTGLVVGIVWA